MSPPDPTEEAPPATDDLALVRVLYDIQQRENRALSEVEIIDIACRMVLQSTNLDRKLRLLTLTFRTIEKAEAHLGAALVEMIKDGLGDMAPEAAERAARFNRQLSDFLTSFHNGDFAPQAQLSK